MATVVIFSWERAMRHLVLENLLWVGLVLETVELVNLSRLAQVYSSNDDEEFFGFITHFFMV